MNKDDQIKLWCKGRLFELMCGIGDNDAKTVLKELLDFIDSDPFAEPAPQDPELSKVERTGKDCKDQPEDDKVWESSKQYALRQVLASTDAEMTEQAYLDLKIFSGFEIAVAHKDGANWQREQMMQNAIEGLVICDEVLTHGLKDIVMKIPKNLQVNDKVKLIIIKED